MILTILGSLIILTIIIFIFVDRVNSYKLNKVLSTIGSISFVLSLIVTSLAITMIINIISNILLSKEIKMEKTKIVEIENRINNLSDDYNNLDLIKLQTEYFTAVDNLNDLNDKLDDLNNTKQLLYFGG